MLCEICDRIGDTISELEAAQRESLKECPNIRAAIVQLKSARHCLAPLAEAEINAAQPEPVKAEPEKPVTTAPPPIPETRAAAEPATIDLSNTV